MTMLLTLLSGKRIMVNFDHVVAVEELGVTDTLITSMKDGRTFHVNVLESVVEIYEMLPYGDHNDC